MTRTRSHAGNDVAAAIGDHGAIAEITTFGAAPFPAFGLALTL
jgi:hypothetical protein